MPDLGDGPVDHLRCAERYYRGRPAVPPATCRKEVTTGKVTFLTGLAGFVGLSAIGGASVNLAMLITGR